MPDMSWNVLSEASATPKRAYEESSKKTGRLDRASSLQESKKRLAAIRSKNLRFMTVADLTGQEEKTYIDLYNQMIQKIQYIEEMKKHAQFIGRSGGEIILVPQKGEGGGRAAAEVFRMNHSGDKKFQDMIKYRTTTGSKKRQALYDEYQRLLDEPSEAEASSSGESSEAEASSSGESSEAEASSSDESRDEGTSYQYYAESERDEAASSDPPEIPIRPNMYFGERYAYNSRIRPYDSGLSGGCGVNTVMTLFHLYNIYPSIEDVKLKLKYPFIRLMHMIGAIDDAEITNTLYEISDGKIDYQRVGGTKSIEEIEEILKEGPIAVQFFPKDAPIAMGNAHILVVDEIETNSNGTFVGILDAQGYFDTPNYKVPRDEWEGIQPIFYYIPE